MDYSKAINELNDKIQKAEQIGENIEPLVLEEINIFEKARKEMLCKIKEQKINYNLNIAEAEIGQLNAMIILSKKINKPVYKYEKRIKEIQQYFVGDNVTIEYR